MCFAFLTRQIAIAGLGLESTVDGRSGRTLRRTRLADDGNLRHSKIGPGEMGEGVLTQLISRRFKTASSRPS